MICVLDGARGIYLPQAFAELVDAEYWGLDSQEDQKNLAILLDGPEHEHYWEAWEEILDRAERIDGNQRYFFIQNSDLFETYEGDPDLEYGF